jgi:hypothetical protein
LASLDQFARDVWLEGLVAYTEAWDREYARKLRKSRENIRNYFSEGSA